ncbi:hypothetical protein FNF28_03945 [Cafeteria roenbergensis]|uniref:Uncharacterized protein n=1 Tax=Cafeteria roenbergensis TaxID=33653 RepID=A0A5A8DI74_CAFRO|nr:hypothetical protein FNF28_03945 [Cafeteria roenbergensis]
MSSPPVEALVASVPQSLSNVRAASELAARLTKAVQRERPAVALVRAAQSATARLLAFVARHQTNDDTAVDYSRRAAAALESVLREQPFDSLEPAVMEAYADTCEMLSDKDGLHADAGHLQRTIAAEQALLKHSSAFALSEWSLYVDTLDAALESSGVTDPADAVMASRLLRGAATALQLLGEAGGTSADISSEARRLADWFRGGSGAGASYSASQEAVDAAASAEARGSFWRLAIAFSALSAKLALAGSNSAIAAANLATEGAARAAADEATLLRSPGAAKAMPASCLLDATWPVLGLDAATVHAAPHSAAIGSSTHTVSAVGAFSAGLSSCGSSVSSGSADGAAPEAAAATGTTAADSAAAAATGGTCDDESAAAAPLGRHRSCLSTASFHCGSATSVASSSSRATRLRRVRFSVETLEEVASHEAPGAAVVPSWHARLRRGLNQAVLEAETGRAAARAAGLKSLALSMAPPAAAILHAPA